MKIDTKFIAVLFSIAFISACASPAAAPTQDIASIQGTAVALAWTDLASTQTASAPTATVTPLHPTETHTPISTPTISSSPTNTSTPVSLSSFVPLTFIEDLRTSPSKYIGTYVKALGNKVDDTYLSEDLANPFWLAPADYNSALGIYADLSIDPAGDNTSLNIKAEEWLWIYGIVIHPKTKYPEISVLHTELIPETITPKTSGVFKVNEQISAGAWKSMSDATQIQDCYWARIANDGSIIDNYFGYGGTTVFISQSDFAVEFDDCGFMVYLGQ